MSKPPDSDRPTTWPGGTIRYSADGTPSFHIRRTMRGRRYEVSTRCTNLTSAMKELLRFEMDPEGYVKKPEAAPEPVRFNDRLLTDYMEWCRTVKQSTPNYLREKRKGLERWQKALAGRDLRTVTTVDLARLLDGAAPLQHRRNSIAFIKALYTWLVTVRYMIHPTQDPAAALRVPQSDPTRRRKAVKHVSREVLHAVLPHLSQVWQDRLLLLAHTGMHVTELNGFAQNGAVLSSLTGSPVLVIPRHKRGGEHKLQISAETAEIANRVRAAGPCCISHFHFALRKACESAGVERFGPGQMRHTFVHAGIESGVPLEALSRYLNHSPGTAKKFYGLHAAVPLPGTPPRT